MQTNEKNNKNEKKYMENTHSSNDGTKCVLFVPAPDLNLRRVRVCCVSEGKGLLVCFKSTKISATT